MKKYTANILSNTYRNKARHDYEILETTFEQRVSTGGVEGIWHDSAFNYLMGVYIQ